MLGTRCGRQGTVCGLEKGEGAGEGDPDAGVCAGLGCAAFGDDNSTTVTNRDPSGAQDLALFAVAFAGNFRRGGGVREGGSRGGGGSFIPKARERRGPRGRKSPVRESTGPGAARRPGWRREPGVRLEHHPHRPCPVSPPALALLDSLHACQVERRERVALGRPAEAQVLDPDLAQLETADAHLARVPHDLDQLRQHVARQAAFIHRPQRAKGVVQPVNAVLALGRSAQSRTVGLTAQFGPEVTQSPPLVVHHQPEDHQ
eukprot:scaffold4420_cov115-Isochrysis_galbana.AAC.6